MKNLCARMSVKKRYTEAVTASQISVYSNKQYDSI